MTSPGQGALRVVRGATLALACTLLALGGHVLGGGDAPPIAALFAVTALVGATFVILAHRQRTFGQIFAAAAATQVAFHTAFSLSIEAYGHPAHDPVASLLNPPMLTGHLLAAGAAAFLLVHGEQAVWAIHGLSALVRLPEQAVVQPIVQPAFQPAPIRRTSPRELLLARSQPRRGPPCSR